MGRTVLGHLQTCPDVKNLVAYDPDPAALEETRRECGVAGYRSLDRILDDESVKLVFVTASNAAHKELVLSALEAGKAVMCEKPMATTLEDSREMAEAASRLNGFLQVGFELRYSHLYKTIKRWIDGGRLGQVRNIHCTYICCEYWGRDSWRVRRQQGGSMFGEKLSHYVDLPRWWAGAEIEEVHSIASPNVVPYYEIRDNYHTSCKFAGGAVSHLAFMMPFASTVENDPLIERLEQQKDLGHELRYLIMGSGGAAETNLFHRTIKRWTFQETAKGFSSELVETLTWEPEQDHFYFHNTHDQSHDIVRRVRDGLPPAISPWDALETMKVCEAADRSIDQGGPIQLADLMETVPV